MGVAPTVRADVCRESKEGILGDSLPPRTSLLQGDQLTLDNLFVFPIHHLVVERNCMQWVCRADCFQSPASGRMGSVCCKSWCEGLGSGSGTGQRSSEVHPVRTLRKSQIIAKLGNTRLSAHLAKEPNYSQIRKHTAQCAPCERAKL